MGKTVRQTFHGYAVPTRLRPQWYVGYMVFQGGVPNLRKSSMTGGGQIVAQDLGLLHPNVMKDYTPPITSSVGGGQVASRPPFLQALFGGTQGTGS